jgi:hypothetical protein
MIYHRACPIIFRDIFHISGGGKIRPCDDPQIKWLIG